MSYSLTFTAREVYDSRQSGITIDAILSLGGKSRACKAKVDPGAEVCLFNREIGEELGLDIESGYPRKLSTLMGTMLSYGHFVTLHTLGLEFDSMIYFAAQPNLPRNLLGCEGWLNKANFGLVYYESTIYLSPRE